MILYIVMTFVFLGLALSTDSYIRKTMRELRESCPMDAVVWDKVRKASDKVSSCLTDLMLFSALMGAFMAMAMFTLHGLSNGTLVPKATDWGNITYESRAASPTVTLKAEDESK